MDTLTDWLPALLQSSDSLFPTGAYAHSAALEEIVRLGLVTDEGSLARFLSEQVVPSLLNLELPYVRYSYQAGKRGDLKSLAEISEDISAWKLCRETREASLQIGRGRLQTARKVFPHALLKQLARSSVAPHHIVVFGWQMALDSMPLEATLSAYFYQASAGICSAALKLIRIGPEGAQRVLHHALTGTRTVIHSSMEIERNRAGWFNPVLEIAAMRHESADERLFIS